MTPLQFIQPIILHFGFQHFLALRLIKLPLQIGPIPLQVGFLPLQVGLLPLQVELLPLVFRSRVPLAEFALLLVKIAPPQVELVLVQQFHH